MISIEDLKNGHVTANGTAQIPYNEDHDFKAIAHFLGIMDDLKVKHSAEAKQLVCNIVSAFKRAKIWVSVLFSQGGTYRTSYMGIVSVFHKNQRIYFTPSAGRIAKWGASRSSSHIKLNQHHLSRISILCSMMSVHAVTYKFKFV